MPGGMRWSVPHPFVAVAALVGGLSVGCQRTCGCAETATAHEWRSDASDYRAAGPPPPEGSMAEDEAELVRTYGQTRAVKVQLGKAAYYGKGLAGNRTASGEIFDPERFTAAHRTLPFGTIVRVVRTDNGSHTYVRINDRGPFGNRSRVIDLAEVAARRLDMIRRGVVDVRLEIVKLGDGRRAER
jgi:rare lipoprotein A (peptidoglycan hydrolase)